MEVRNFQIHVFPDFNLRKSVIETSRYKFITIIEWFLARIIMTKCVSY